MDDLRDSVLDTRAQLKELLAATLTEARIHAGVSVRMIIRMRLLKDAIQILQAIEELDRLDTSEDLE